MKTSVYDLTVSTSAGVVHGYQFLREADGLIRLQLNAATAQLQVAYSEIAARQQAQVDAASSNNNQSADNNNGSWEDHDEHDEHDDDDHGEQEEHDDEEHGDDGDDD